MFVVASTYQGPIWPAAQANETWRQVAFSHDASKMKVSDGAQSSASILTWIDDNCIAYGGNHQIYKYDTAKRAISRFYKCSNWRGIQIHDFAGSPIHGEITLVGSTFIKNLQSWSEERKWSLHHEIEDISHSDWNKISYLPRTSEYVHMRLAGPYKKGLFMRESLDGLSYKLTMGSQPERRVEASIDVSGLRYRAFFRDDGFLPSPSGQYLALYSGPYPSSGGLVCAFPIDPTITVALGDWSLHPQTGEIVGVLCWHPVQDYYATTYCSDRYGAPYGFRVIDAVSRQIIADIPVDRRDISSCMDWSSDGRYLALGGHDRAIFVWDFQTGVQSNAILGHGGEIKDVRFSPDGSRLATCCDKETLVWSTETWRLLTRFSGNFNLTYYQRVNGSPWNRYGNKIAVHAPHGVSVHELQT